MAIEIRSIDDLAQLSDEEMSRCMNALRSAIMRHKKDCARRTSGNADQGFVYFTWSLRPVRKVQALGGDTLIEEVVLHPRTREKLAGLGIVRLVDLTEITEEELRNEPMVGPATLARLSDLLCQAELRFLPPRMPD